MEEQLAARPLPRGDQVLTRDSRPDARTRLEAQRRRGYLDRHQLGPIVSALEYVDRFQQLLRSDFQLGDRL